MSTTDSDNHSRSIWWPAHVGMRIVRMICILGFHMDLLFAMSVVFVVRLVILVVGVHFNTACVMWAHLRSIRLHCSWLHIRLHSITHHNGAKAVVRLD